MTITADSILSWPVALWFCVGVVIVVTAWRLSMHVRVMWQRVFFRVGVIALCFAPLPDPQMFTEAAMAGYVAVIPFWYALFWSIAHGAVLGVAVTLILWVVITYLLWVAGMSIHHLFRKSHAA